MNGPKRGCAWTITACQFDSVTRLLYSRLFSVARRDLDYALGVCHTRVPLPSAFKFEVGPIWPHFGVLLRAALPYVGRLKVRDFNPCMRTVRCFHRQARRATKGSNFRNFWRRSTKRRRVRLFVRGRDGDRGFGFSEPNTRFQISDSSGAPKMSFP